MAAHATQGPACLRPASSVQYESPLSSEFAFLEPVGKRDDGLDMLYYALNYIGTFLVPVPGIPSASLTPEVLRNPAGVIRHGAPNALREYPRLLYLGTMGVALALVFPVFGLCLLVCRCCCGACGGGTNRVESRVDECWRCLCFFSLGACCIFMIVASGVAVATELYTYAGIGYLLPYAKRVIQDLETGYLKTQHEIDTLLLRDYAIFENEMAQRLDNCVKLIGEDLESILAANPVLLAKKLVDHIDVLTAEALPLREATDQYVAAASALQIKTNFSSGNSSIKDVTDQCLLLQPQSNLCDPVLQTTIELQAQIYNFDQLPEIGEKVRNYWAVLHVANVTQFLPAINKVANANAKDFYMRMAEAGVREAKRRLKNFGDELGDKANIFYIDALEYPEDLLASVNEHFGRHYKKGEPLLLGYVAFSAALVSLLMLPTMLYLCGMTVVLWGNTNGFCTYRSGRWCFSLGACLFVVSFGVVALATTVGLVVTFFLTRCGCTIVADLANPEVADPVRFLVQIVQVYTGDDSTASKILTSVSLGHLLGIVMRFGVCRSEPRSAYHLVGDSFVRNASKAIGLESELSFLWNGFDNRELEKQIGNIGLSLSSVLNVSAISALATHLEQLVQVPFQALEAREIQTQVERTSFKDVYAIALKTALQKLQQGVAAQPPLISAVAAAVTEVDDIINDLADCELKKRVLEDALKKLHAMLEIDSRPIEVFKTETIAALKDTKAIQAQIDKVSGMIASYKNNLAEVVKGYGDYVVSQGGFWFSVASCLAVGVAAMFMALCLSTLYSRKPRPLRPPPVPKPEQYMEPMAQPLLDRWSPPPEYQQHPVELRGSRHRRRVMGQRESCIMESTDNERDHGDSSGYSCSCIFGNSLPSYGPEYADGNMKNKTSKESKLGESNVKGAKTFKHAQTQTGDANEGLLQRDAEEILLVTVKVKDEPVEMTPRKGTQKETAKEKPYDQDACRIRKNADDLRGKPAERVNEGRNGKEGNRPIIPSSTDVRVVRYEPPAARIQTAMRHISRRLMPFGQESSLFRSVNNSAHMLGRRLFSRYRAVD